MTKTDREIMEILEAFDLTRCPYSAAGLAGCDPKTVQRYVEVRDAGRNPLDPIRRPRLIDPFLEKIEELVERSEGMIRADVAHADHLVPMGFPGDERTTRRAVAESKAAYRSGQRRTYRPWVPEPGMWMQYDWGDGPLIGGRKTSLFCAWVAWSRFRVIIPTWDKKLPTAIACIDETLRTIGGAPTYLLTDNERTVTTDHVCGLPVRHPEMVAAGCHYGMKVETCVPYDPETKGGSESTVKIAKADLVPTKANLLDDYGTFATLEVACFSVMATVNARLHTETKRAPADMLAEERARLHALPKEPYAVALGETRMVRDDQTVRWGSVRYSTPPGHVGEAVHCRVQGEELVIVGKTANGLREICRHELSTPGQPRIVDAHYPGHEPGNGPKTRQLRPDTEEERAFLALGDGAERWLREAAGTGVARVRSKMAEAVSLACLVGSDLVDRALGTAAMAGRFADGDLASIVTHLESHGAASDLVIADEAFSAQTGTGCWEGYGL